MQEQSIYAHLAELEEAAVLETEISGFDSPDGHQTRTLAQPGSAPALHPQGVGRWVPNAARYPSARSRRS